MRYTGIWGEAMEKTLEILWEGRVPGLEEHRLSLTAFGQALNQLLVAYRRIASNMLVEADSATGRLAKAAKLIDLQLVSIKEGSAGIAAACVLDAPPAANLELFETLPSRAADALLSDIEAEAKGEFRNAAVRNYLKALPEGITGQKYTLIDNGRTRELSIGSMKLAEGPVDMPILQERTYAIVGVGFEPGDTFVRLKGAEDAPVTCDATRAQVDRALELRFGSVRALVVRTGRKARLIRLRRAGEDLRPLSPEQEEHLLFGKWNNVLEKLAK